MAMATWKEPFLWSEWPTEGVAGVCSFGADCAPDRGGPGAYGGRLREAAAHACAHPLQLLVLVHATPDGLDAASEPLHELLAIVVKRVARRQRTDDAVLVPRPAAEILHHSCVLRTRALANQVGHVRDDGVDRLGSVALDGPVELLLESVSVHETEDVADADLLVEELLYPAPHLLKHLLNLQLLVVRVSLHVRHEGGQLLVDHFQQGPVASHDLLPFLQLRRGPRRDGFRHAERRQQLVADFRLLAELLLDVRLQLFEAALLPLRDLVTHPGIGGGMSGLLRSQRFPGADGEDGAGRAEERGAVDADKVHHFPSFFVRVEEVHLVEHENHLLAPRANALQELALAL
eukprot:scaffold652_cov260-Pinguiococcus_pyrenoidosus.AAC.12